jgi:hypothetical protein
LRWSPQWKMKDMLSASFCHSIGWSISECMAGKPCTTVACSWLHDISAYRSRTRIYINTVFFASMYVCSYCYDASNSHSTDRVCCHLQ